MGRIKETILAKPLFHALVTKRAAHQALLPYSCHQIYQMRQDGLTLQQIGDKIGRTRERARQILAKYPTPVRLSNKTILKEVFYMHPFKITVVAKEEVSQIIHRVSGIPSERFAFLLDLKAKLQPHQAIAVIVPPESRQSLAVYWRGINKGQHPHSASRPQEDGSRIVYLWLGALVD